MKKTLMVFALILSTVSVSKAGFLVGEPDGVDVNIAATIVATDPRLLVNGAVELTLQAPDGTIFSLLEDSRLDGGLKSKIEYEMKNVKPGKYKVTKVRIQTGLKGNEPIMADAKINPIDFNVTTAPNQNIQINMTQNQMKK